MHDEHPHPLLAQVPLTVSPFLSLPTATPLPYTYKTLPSTLPPSILSAPPTTNATSQDPSQPHQIPHPAYILSSTGQTAASPDSILTSCLSLQQHLAHLETSARQTLKQWEDRRKAEELAEKRRVAPGWLDGDVKLLVPENVEGPGAQERPQPERRTSVGIKALVERRDGPLDSREGEELDRAFGGMDIQ